MLHLEWAAALREKAKALARKVKRQLALYQAVMADPRTPKGGKILLGAAIGYLLLPIDLVPGSIPILGQLDDVIVVVTLVFFATRVIPRWIFEEHQTRLDATQPESRTGDTPSARD